MQGCQEHVDRASTSQEMLPVHVQQLRYHKEQHQLVPMPQTIITKRQIHIRIIDIHKIYKVKSVNYIHKKKLTLDRTGSKLKVAKAGASSLYV